MFYFYPTKHLIVISMQQVGMVAHTSPKVSVPRTVDVRQTIDYKSLVVTCIQYDG